MRVTLTEAERRLPELVRRAEAGEDVILTRSGHPAVRLVSCAAPLRSSEPAQVRCAPDAMPEPDPQATRRAVIAAVRGAARRRGEPGVTAARSQDFLYDEDGLPL